MRRLQKKTLKLAEIGSWGLRNEAVSIAWECKVKQQMLMQRLQQVIHSLAKIILCHGNTKQQIFSVDRTAFY